MMNKYIINDTVEKRIHEMTENIFSETEGGVAGVVQGITIGKDYRKGQQRSPKKDKKKNSGLLGDNGDASDSINLTLDQVKSLLGTTSSSIGPDAEKK